MLRQRLISGSLIGTAIIALVIVDAWLSTIAPPITAGRHIWLDAQRWLMNGSISTAIVLVLTWLTASELVRFAEIMGFRPFSGLAKLFTAGFVVGPYLFFNLQALSDYRDESWAMLWLAIALGCGFLMQAIRRRTEHAMVNLATTVFIIFYAGGLAGYMIRLRMEVGGASGAALLLFSMFVVKMTDTGAFFIGSLAGRNKLVEWLSPKKTWEGFFGGLAVAMALSMGVGLLLHRSELLHVGPAVGPPLLGLALFGLLMGLFSVAGDLCASLLKRDAAVKDSSNRIPGMGGILDIIDSPLLAAPVAWFFWTRIAPWGG